MQSIKTPRIYINIPEYLAENGGSAIHPVYRTIVSSYLADDIPMSDYDNIIYEPISIPSGILSDQSFIAILGHAFDTNSDFYGVSNDGADSTLSLSEIINATSISLDNSHYSHPSKDGFSISRFNGEGSTQLSPVNINPDQRIGSIVMGIFYNFPFAPDMKVSISYEYGKTTEQVSVTGSSISNTMFLKSPKWLELGAWELGDSNSGGIPEYAKSGRRIFDMSFSYISDTDAFPENAGLMNEDGSNTNTLLNTDTLQRALHLSNGGQIPFILQIDKTEAGLAQDQLAIVQLDSTATQFSLLANNMYRVKLRFRETW